MRDSTYWTRGGLRGRTIGRRGFLAASGVAAAGTAAMLAGCGDDDENEEVTPASGSPAGEGTPAMTATPEVKQPRTGGTFRKSFSGGDAHLSPTHTGGYDIYTTFSTIYEYMWREARDGAVIMQGAEKVEQADETTYIITLRDHVYQDVAPVSGRAVTAEDVKLLADYIIADKQVFARAFYAGRLDSVTAVDQRTVRVVTKGPQAYFFDGAVGFDRPLIPKELLADGDLRKVKTQIGSGPWQFGSQTPGSFVEFVKFPRYWRTGQPYIEKVRATKIDDEAARETAFRGNQIDTMVPSNPRLYRTLLADLGKDVTGTEGFAAPIAFAMNPNRKPFDDPRVRKAVHRALDLNALLKIAEFGEGKLCGIVGPSLERYQIPDSELTDYLKYDPAEAKRLLQEAGFDTNKSWEFVIRSDSTEHQTLAPLIKEQLLASGIKTTFADVPQAEYQQRTFAEPGRFDFTISAVGADIGRVLRDHHSKSLGVREAYSINNSEVDTLIEKTEVTINASERVALYKEIQRKLLGLWPAYFPLYSARVFRVNRSYIRDFDPDPELMLYPQQPQMWLDR